MNEAIDGLRLRDVFAQSHKPFDECWSVSMDSRILVVDDDDTHATRYSDDPYDEGRALLVINDANKQIFLLSIDNKLIASRQGGISDGALLDIEQFHFIEFKTNALGNSDESIIDTFDKAISQLKQTVSLFVERFETFGIDLLGSRDVMCHVVVSNRFPRARAVRQNYMLKFWEDVGLDLSFSEKLYWEKRS